MYCWWWSLLLLILTENVYVYLCSIYQMCHAFLGATLFAILKSFSECTWSSFYSKLDLDGEREWIYLYMQLFHPGKAGNSQCYLASAVVNPPPRHWDQWYRHAFLQPRPRRPNISPGTLIGIDPSQIPKTTIMPRGVTNTRTKRNLLQFFRQAKKGSSFCILFPLAIYPNRILLLLARVLWYLPFPFQILDGGVCIPLSGSVPRAFLGGTLHGPGRGLDVGFLSQLLLVVAALTAANVALVLGFLGLPGDYSRLGLGWGRLRQGTGLWKRNVGVRDFVPIAFTRLIWNQYQEKDKHFA